MSREDGGIAGRQSPRAAPSAAACVAYGYRKTAGSNSEPMDVALPCGHYREVVDYLFVARMRGTYCHRWSSSPLPDCLFTSWSPLTLCLSYRPLVGDSSDASTVPRTIPPTFPGEPPQLGFGNSSFLFQMCIGQPVLSCATTQRNRPVPIRQYGRPRRLRTRGKPGIATRRARQWTEKASGVQTQSVPK